MAPHAHQVLLYTARHSITRSDALNCYGAGPGQDVVDFAAVKSTAVSDTELIAISGVQDVVNALEALQLLREDMHLQQFDCVQVNRGGVGLLRIVNTPRASGRSVVVEVNEYRRRLQGVRVAGLHSGLRACFAVLIVAVVSMPRAVTDVWYIVCGVWCVVCSTLRSRGCQAM